MTTQFRRQGMMARGNRPARELPPRQNVAVLVDQYVIADRRKSTPETDYLEGFLLHDVPEWGLKATYETLEGEEGPGAPTTRVKVTMPPPRNGEGSRRRDIYGLSKPKGAGVAMDQGSIVVFERAYFDKKDSTIKAPYAHGTANEQQRADGLKFVMWEHLVCVRPEDYIHTGPRAGWAGRVDVLIADPKRAELVRDDADLRAKVEQLIADSGLGNPGFALLARQLAPEGVDPVTFAADPNTRLGGFSVSRRQPVEVEGQTEKQWIPETADQLYERFARENRDFAQIVGQPDWQVEFLPIMAVNQAKSLVPSLAEQAGERMRDNSTIYGIYGEIPEGDAGAHARNPVTDENGRSFGQIDCGWMPSQVVVERKDVDSDVWYSTYQTAMAQKSDVDSIHDLRTPLTPDYHLQAIVAEAARNAEGKKAYYAAKKPDAPEAAEELEQQGPAPGR